MKIYYFAALLVSVILYVAVFVAFAIAYSRYKLMYKNLLKQSFSMTIAMGEYHMWVEDHIEAYLTKQVLNNSEFLEFAKKSGLSITAFENHLKDTMKSSAEYIKFQSKECLRKVSEPLAQDINEVLEKQ
jgi:hypothetical protein